jgi:hypothetical protein
MTRLSLALTVAFFLYQLSSEPRIGAAYTAQSALAEHRILRVGPGQPYAVPSQAAAAAKDGDVVEISPALYAGDAAVWRANDLTLRGVGGRPHLIADGASALGKAIWVIQGNNVLIENIQFSGAKVPDENGAAIRAEAEKLVIRDCYIHDNQMGILAGNANADILIENSEFSGSYGDHNHNIYMGNIRQFTLQFSYIHHASQGHNVKTRARTNFILYNRIMDEKSGSSSYAIDIPNGGRSYIIGNVIQKGPNAENSSVIAYAAEGATNELQELYVVNNTVVSEFRRGLFLNIHVAPAQLLILNNIFAGAGVALNTTTGTHHNLVGHDAMFQNKPAYDYRLLPNSPAIDAGSDPGVAAGFNLNPQFQYVHPVAHETRKVVGATDLGAFEYDAK